MLEFEPAGVLEIAECTGHIKSGGKKDAIFIADLFLKHMAKTDPTTTLIECVFFDGASNVQKAGAILRVTYPRVTMLHVAEHVEALFFKDISNLAPIKYQIVRDCFMYSVFGSGAMHSPDALFQKHARSFNSSRAIWLLCASETHMVRYFMAMNRDLRLKGALRATVASSDFISLKVKSFKDPTNNI
jgi:hypothetical protein